MRRSFAQAVVFALVLPVLIGLLPQPALSASAALERDFAASLCGQGVPRLPDGGPQHQERHDHCLLCSNHCSSASPSLAAATPAFSAQPRRLVIPEAATALIVAAPLQAFLDASPPRGPPAA